MGKSYAMPRLIESGCYHVAVVFKSYFNVTLATSKRASFNAEVIMKSPKSLPSLVDGRKLADLLPS